MSESIADVARRIREMREDLEWSVEAAARRVGLTADQYTRYESAVDDIPVGVIYRLAAEFKVDSTVLLQGDGPRMRDYTVVRGGRGVRVDRYAGYTFTALASNFQRRDMDPMIVTLERSDEPPALVTHPGQEFNYVLEGTVEVVIGGRTFSLDAGDSIYFNPQIPHGQRALSGTTRFLTVINESQYVK